VSEQYLSMVVRDITMWVLYTRFIDEILAFGKSSCILTRLRAVCLLIVATKSLIINGL
jgi:hypothetical protein